MSRANKVNKDYYTQRGRLTPDELARERARAVYVSDTKRRFTARTKQTPARSVEPESSRDQTGREEEE
jgi:hypothetical protein